MPDPISSAGASTPILPVAQRQQGPGLDRVLGLPAAISIVIGTVIGSGVFLVPTSMIHNVGSVPMLFGVWVIAGLLSLFGALTYGELAAAMPEAGGEYVYLSAAYGPFWGFLYGWTQFWVAKSGSLATIAAGFYTYLTVFIPALAGTVYVVPLPIGPGGKPLEIHWGQLVAIALIMALGVVNYAGVRGGGGVQVLTTIVKVSLLIGVIVTGLVSPAGNWQHLSGHIPALGGITGFFAAMVSALWAYDGWNNVSMVSSEIRSPQRNLPGALIFGTLAVIAIYISINLAYFFVLGADGVAASEHVAADMMAKAAGPVGARVVVVAVLISTFAALNGSILSGARIPYAMARDGLFVRQAARIHPRFHTPSSAILMLCAWGSVLVLSGWFDDLYNFVIFGSWILYLLSTLSVIVLRRRAPKMARPYRVIGYPLVPVLFSGVAVLLLVSTLATRPRESLMGLGLMLVSIPFYIRWRNRLRRTDEQIEQPS